jgi:4-amino-4-deoxy-L-arabinose transferase-like glycosyltransferase
MESPPPPPNPAPQPPPQPSEAQPDVHPDSRPAAKTERKPDPNPASAIFKPAPGPVSPLKPAPPITANPAGWLSRHDGTPRPISAWLILIVLIALYLPLALINLSGPAITGPEEARAMAIAIETNNRQHNFKLVRSTSPEYWLPQHAGMASTETPPAAVWTHLIGLRIAETLDPDPTPADRLLWARITSVLAGMLALAAVFWAGHSLAGQAGAGIAGLLCVASPLFLWHARQATPTMLYMAGWTLAIASALWALRPLRPAPSAARQSTGWILCGLATALTVLSVGPGAFLSVGLPILLFVVLCPNRISHLLGWFTALLIACLVLTPWAIFIVKQTRESLLDDASIFVPAHWSSLTQLAHVAGQRALYLPLSLGPWLLWIAGAIAQPFSASAAGVRVRMFLGWSAFAVAIIVTLGAHELEWWSCLAVCVPASALLLAQLMSHYSDLAEVGRYPRSWRLIVWPHASILLLAPLATAWALFTPSVLDRPLAPWSPADPSVALCVAGAGLLLALVAMRYASADDPRKAMSAWALVVCVMMLGVIPQLARGPLATTQLQQEGRRLSRLAMGAPVFRLAPARGDQTSLQMDTLSVYAGAGIFPVAPNQTPLLEIDNPRYILLTPLNFTPTDKRLEPVAKLPESALAAWRFPAAWVPAHTQPADSQPAQTQPDSQPSTAPGDGSL